MAGPRTGVATFGLDSYTNTPRSGITCESAHPLQDTRYFTNWLS
jgi:hypothetical protein